MKEKRTIQTVQKSIAAFSRENRRMPSFAEMVSLLGVRSKSVVNFWIDKLIEAEILEKALLQRVCSNAFSISSNRPIGRSDISAITGLTRCAFVVLSFQ